MPIYKAKNEKFFRTWSPEMAYVLGFFTADGNMIKNKRGAHFIGFEITDKELLQSIKSAMGCGQKISMRKRVGNNVSYSLQVGSKAMFSDLQKLGLTPRKSKTVRLPPIPNRYFRHFVRGYFDGDGNVVFGFFKRFKRRTLKPVFLTRFTSGSKVFLDGMKERLFKNLKLSGSLSFYSGAWRLGYSSTASKKLFQFMYPHSDSKNLIYLRRKHRIYQRAERYYAGVA